MKTGFLSIVRVVLLCGGIVGCSVLADRRVTSIPDPISISYFYTALAPYGLWFEHPLYGKVWRPRGIGKDWRPYTEGHWLYTQSYGWYWASDEEWGWAPFHYGRWAYDSVTGWIWIPGTVWAPAWVSWQYNQGFYAWAPLPPEMNWHPDFGLSFAYGNVYTIPYASWVVMPQRFFSRYHVSRYVYPPHQNHHYINRPHNNYSYLTLQNNRLVNSGIPIIKLERELNQRVVTLNKQEADAVIAQQIRDATGAANIVPPKSNVKNWHEAKREQDLAFKIRQETNRRIALDPGNVNSPINYRYDGNYPQLQGQIQLTWGASGVVTQQRSENQSSLTNITQKNSQQVLNRNISLQNGMGNMSPQYDQQAFDQQRQLELHQQTLKYRQNNADALSVHQETARQYEEQRQKTLNQRALQEQSLPVPFVDPSQAMERGRQNDYQRQLENQQRQQEFDRLAEKQRQMEVVRKMEQQQVEESARQREWERINQQQQFELNQSVRRHENEIQQFNLQTNQDSQGSSFPPQPEVQQQAVQERQHEMPPQSVQLNSQPQIEQSRPIEFQQQVEQQRQMEVQHIVEQVRPIEIKQPPSLPSEATSINLSPVEIPQTSPTMQIPPVEVQNIIAPAPSVQIEPPSVPVPPPPIEAPQSIAPAPSLPVEVQAPPPPPVIENKEQGNPAP